MNAHELAATCFSSHFLSLTHTHTDKRTSANTKFQTQKHTHAHTQSYTHTKAGMHTQTHILKNTYKIELAEA